MSASAVRNAWPNSRNSPWRQITNVESIRQIGLSTPLTVIGGILFASYVLRMTAIPWPLPRDLTNYLAIILACIAGVLGHTRVAPMYILALVVTIPSVFVSSNFEDSGLRWSGWALLIIAVGPPLMGPRVFQFRLFVMLLLVAFVHLATVGSGVLGLVGVQAPGGRGPFWGLLSHSNSLGTIASLAAIDSLSKWSSGDSRWSKRLWFVILLIELSTSLRAASRTALLGFFVCSMALMYVRNARSKGQVIFTMIVLLTASAGYYSMRESLVDNRSVYGQYIRDLAEKGLRNTREQLWQDRIREFQSSPVFGIGFCRGGIEGMRVRDDGFMQEPGSSYLAALSMTGIVGVLGFLILISPLITTTAMMLGKRYGADPPFYAIAAPFWLVAMTTEGFSHYVGNPFCFIVILWCGVAASGNSSVSRAYLSPVP